MLFQTDTFPPLTGGEAEAFAGIMAVMAGFLVFFFIFAIAMYIFMGLALMNVAKRLKVEPAWLAWVPIGNLVLMAKMAKMHWWPVLLLLSAFIPVIGFIGTIALTIFIVIWTYKICEARGKPGWWAIITLIPFVGGIWSIVMWGILAWGK